MRKHSRHSNAFTRRVIEEYLAARCATPKAPRAGYYTRAMA